MALSSYLHLQSSLRRLKVLFDRVAVSGACRVEAEGEGEDGSWQREIWRIHDPKVEKGNT